MHTVCTLHALCILETVRHRLGMTNAAAATLRSIPCPVKILGGIRMIDPRLHLLSLPSHPEIDFHLFVVPCVDRDPTSTFHIPRIKNPEF